MLQLYPLLALTLFIMYVCFDVNAQQNEMEYVGLSQTLSAEASVCLHQLVKFSDASKTDNLFLISSATKTPKYRKVKLWFSSFYF